ncbi:hypothetical protein Tco_0747457 [Tanacetum coccineum]|uniref:Uncharacterized protein n=1 Tax=Tanacetum coccineum TaxID=301880 RepID=A0ABQ4YTS8_9ASTR
MQTNNILTLSLLKLKADLESPDLDGVNYQGSLYFVRKGRRSENLESSEVLAIHEEPNTNVGNLLMHQLAEEEELRKLRK